MKRAVEAWNRFWFASGSPATLALFRILFAYCLYREVATTHTRAVFAIDTPDFHLPWTSLIPRMSAETYELVHGLEYGLIALVGLGIFMRSAAGCLLVLQGWVLFADKLNFRNHPYFFLLVLLLLMLSPADRALSVRSILAGARRGLGAREKLLGNDEPLTFQRAICVQVSLVYFYAALHKLHPLYLKGEVLERLLLRDALAGDSGRILRSLFGPDVLDALLTFPGLMLAASWGTILVELFLAFGLWHRRTRPIAIVLGLGLHASIAFIMDINTFSLAAVATYLLFLDPDTLPGLVPGRRRSPAMKVRRRRGFASVLLVAAALASAAPARAAGPPPRAEDWVTPAEASEFRSTPTHEQTLAFLRRLDEALPEMSLTTFGRSAAGRELPLVIVSADGAATPARAAATGKPIVLVQNAIHAGEVDGKDACLMLLRDLVLGRRDGWVDDVILLVVPILNADGHERVSPWSRPNQNGPVEGTGFRTTADGHDLNRDHLKLDTPEMRALVRLAADWRPHLHVDDHVTDGVDHAWVLTWSWVEGPQIAPQVARWLDEHLPPVLAQLEAAGHPNGPYVDLVDRDDPGRGFSSWVGQPRYATGYWPLRNRPSILVENHAYASFRERVAANLELLQLLLERVAAAPRALVEAVETADRRTVALGRPGAEPSQVVLRWNAVPSGDTRRLPLRAWRTETSVVTGEPVVLWEPEETRPLDVPWIHRSEAAIAVARPRGYVVEPGWPDVERPLRDHGLVVRRTTRPVTIDVETIHLVEARRDPGVPGTYQGRSPFEIQRVERRRARREVPAGALFVPADQPGFEIAVQLLEPEAPDSLASWGQLAIVLESKEWIAPWILERHVRERLDDDLALRAEWERALADPGFAADPRRRRQWWVERTPWAEAEDRGRLPVLRVLDVAPLAGALAP